MTIIALDIKIKPALQTWRDRNYEGARGLVMRRGGDKITNYTERLMRPLKKYDNIGKGFDFSKAKSILSSINFKRGI